MESALSAIATRRSQKDRSTAMQEKLSITAFSLIRDGGYASLRTATVAKKAGVSQGGLLHHYPTKDSLALAAVEYATLIAIKKTQANLDAFALDSDPVRSIANDSKDYYFSASFDVALDVTKSAAPNPELRRSIARLTIDFREHTERSWLAKLIDRGWTLEDGEDVVALTTSVVRGFAMRQIIRRDPEEKDRLIERWIKMVYASIDQGSQSASRT